MNVLFRIIVAIQNVLCWLLAPFLLCKSKRQYTIPKIKNNVLKCSATVLAQKIRNRELSSVEIIQAYIERINEVNPYINAVVEDRFLGALEDAKRVDEIIANNTYNLDVLTAKYPLFGVPVTIKESCSLNGLSYCVGSKKRIGVKAMKDGDAVRKLKDAGAIPLLVSTTPELSLSWETTNSITGKTLSPYNRNYSSGGSSGGEGALLGSGASVIGIGSDVAGSIRVPAMFNGVFGHKPTPKVISIGGHYPSSSDKLILEYLVIGPLTRYAQDLKLMMKVLSVDNNALNLNEKIDLTNMTIYYSYEPEKGSLVIPSTHKDIKEIMKKALNYLKINSKSTISDYKFDMTETCEMSATLFYKMDDIPSVMRDQITGEINKNVYLEMIKAFFGLSDFTLHGLFFTFLQHTNVFVPRSKFDFYKAKGERLKNDFIEKLGSSGVFLYPTFPIPGLKHNLLLLKTATIMYTMVFNVLGMPATHVTLGKSKNGLPIGIQIVAAPNQDRLCLAVAEELERYFGGWIEP